MTSSIYLTVFSSVYLLQMTLFHGTFDLSPDSAPQCSRLRSHTANAEMKPNEKKKGYVEAMIRLYMKYIDPEEAYLEVNLSSKVKKELVKAFKSLHLTLEPFEQVLPLLDQAAVEISGL